MAKAARVAAGAAATVGCAVALSGCGSSSPAAAATTGTTPASSFNQALVSTTTTIVHPPPVPKPAKSAKAKAKTSSKPASSPPATSHPASGGTVTVIHTVTVPGGGGGGTRTITHTVTVFRTTTVPANTGVPSGAHVPSSLPAESHSAFSMDGGLIGCSLGGGTARCDVASSVWSPPAKPAGCHAAWGQGLAVGPGGPAHFVCASNSALNPGATSVAYGRDVVYQGATCQVRFVGVTCFDGSGNGFYLSRTGYYFF